LSSNRKEPKEIARRSYKAIVGGFLLAVLGLHAFLLWNVRGRVQKGDPDFTVYYTAARILREGRAAALYDAATQQAVQWEFATDTDIRRGPLPYIHPPSEALIFLPLTYLNYTAAFWLWNVVNLLLLTVIAQLLQRSVPSLGVIPLWQWVVAWLAFFPVFANFLLGQDAILLLLVLVLAFRALERDAMFLAGCWLGLGMFKYHFVIPIVVILAVWRGWRLIAGFSATCSLLGLLSLTIVGWHGALLYPAYAWRVVSVPGHGQTPPGLMANFLGLFTGWPWPANVARGLQFAVAVASLALLIVVARMRRFARDQYFFRLSFGCAVIAAVLVGYNTNMHDLCLLVLPLALLADHCAAGSTGWPQTRALLVPVLPLLISPLWIFLWLAWGKVNLMALFLLWWLYAMRKEIAGTSEDTADLMFPA
jgi:Glycosyltransferase family 87